MEPGIRYIVNDVPAAVAFYQRLGFADTGVGASGFALSCGGTACGSCSTRRVLEGPVSRRTTALGRRPVAGTGSRSRSPTSLMRWPA